MKERAGLWALRQLDPERAHGVALWGLRRGLVSLPGIRTSDRLRTVVAGLRLANPVGLAAGFDKNAVAIGPLTQAGFGFLEVGGTTPRPQIGNPRPRLFRLPDAEAVINRFGFNNEGMTAMAAQLAKGPFAVPVGLNLGANKDSPDRSDDYAQVLRRCGPYADFVTVNVSSPNTAALRDLQGRAALTAVLQGVQAARQDADLPVFLKIAPDLTEAEIADIAEVALQVGVDAIIATNTTLDRSAVSGPFASEAGGLSGRPLMDRSTEVLARLYRETGGAIPLIGVGGIASAEDAYAKIRAGASAVQLYTALVYQGLSLVPRILDGIETLLDRDGFANVAEAVGAD